MSWTKLNDMVCFDVIEKIVLNGRWEWWAVDMHKYIIYYDDFNRFGERQKEKQITDFHSVHHAMNGVKICHRRLLLLVICLFFCVSAISFARKAYNYLFVCLFVGHIDFHHHNHRINIIEFDTVEAFFFFHSMFSIQSFFASEFTKKIIINEWTTAAAADTFCLSRRTLSNL